MAFTTIPSVVITLIVFSILSLNINATGTTNVDDLLRTIETTFNITPYLFIVPILVVVLILFKTKPLIALGAGVGVAGVFAMIFQTEVLLQLSDSETLTLMKAIFTDTQVVTENESLNELFSSGGMKGMLWTIFLIICAMVFGGIMDGIGALSRITSALLSIATTIFGLFASTVVSCLGLNVIASDQYLALVIPGKMFR